MGIKTGGWFLGLVLLSALTLAACGDRSGGGGASTGPTTNVTINCSQTAGGTGGGVGNTTTNVDVNCPADSGNTTDNSTNPPPKATQ